MTIALEPFIGQVKSRLLPLSPMAGALEWLIERLPRRLVRVELNPFEDISLIDESKGEYSATGNAPSFEVSFAPASLQAGWYYLEAALVRNNGSREASIRADIRGEGSITIPVSTNLRGTVREVFYVPPNVTALYLLPTAAPGFFSLSRLLLHKITPLESALRRICRVLFDFWRFRGASAIHVGIAWLRAIGNLQDAYRYTASLRIKRLMVDDYASFIASNDRLKKNDIRAMRKWLSHSSRRPVISLIMHVRDPKADFFIEALDSVSGQSYPHWELLLAGDFSSDMQSYGIADKYRRKNARVKIVPVKSGTDLAATFNSALQLAQGEFVARICQHDQLHPHALFSFACVIGNHPDADLIYSDDDSIDGTSKRHDPRFKPDWNPELFYSYNYLANLTLCRHARVSELGGYRAGFECAEDYDLSLRIIGKISASQIRHIPKVLYHSRTINRPLAPTNLLLPEDGGAESGHHSGKRALSDYFEGSGAIVEDGPASDLYRIRYPLPAQLPLVSIIIPTRDKVGILRACIESIQQKTDYDNWEILVVDNQSVEADTLAYLEKIKGDARIRLIRYEKSFNYSAMNNLAAQYARGEILALLNNDVEVIAKEWLSEMVSHAIRPETGAVGAKLLYPNGRIQHAGVITGIGGVAGHAHKYMEGDGYGYCHRAVVTQNLSAVTGACLVVRKSCYQEAGGLNENDLVVALNDIDFCLKLLKKGYRNVFTPYARLYHHESISRGSDDTPEKHALIIREFEYMKKTWGKILQHDPAYNPNLTLEFEDFSLTKDYLRAGSGLKMAGVLQ